MHNNKIPMYERQAPWPSGGRWWALRPEA